MWDRESPGGPSGTPAEGLGPRGHFSPTWGSLYCCQFTSETGDAGQDLRQRLSCWEPDPVGRAESPEHASCVQNYSLNMDGSLRTRKLPPRLFCWVRIKLRLWKLSPLLSVNGDPVSKGAFWRDDARSEPNPGLRTHCECVGPRAMPIWNATFYFIMCMDVIICFRLFQFLKNTKLILHASGGTLTTWPWLCRVAGGQGGGGPGYNVREETRLSLQPCFVPSLAAHRLSAAGKGPSIS